MNQVGNVAIWGTGAKGVTFVNNVDPNCALVNCVIDVNPNKQRKFIPGAGHLVISPEEIEIHQINNIIVMNPNYFGEIKQSLENKNLNINLII